MDIRYITPGYAVSPQISPEDAEAIANAGFKGVICNRPDAEVPPELRADQMRASIEAAGLNFDVLPITHDSMTPDRIAKQRALIEAANGPVLAYCASGTRCSVIWALGQSDVMSADDILSATARAGYSLDALRSRLENG